MQVKDLDEAVSKIIDTTKTEDFARDQRVFLLHKPVRNERHGG